MSGNERRMDGSLIPGDALQVKTMSGVEQPLESMCPYIYENAVSPHLASRIEGNPVHLSVVKQSFQAVCDCYDYVTMEGSGGILCPICFDEAKIQLVDIVRELDLSSLIIADAGLGTINNVVLTVAYMRSKGLTVKGIVFNHYHPGDRMEKDNKFMCEYMTGLKVLACVRDGDQTLDMDAEALTSLYE
jgi:dethiobiotin synthetase